MKKKITGILLIICIVSSMVLTGFKSGATEDKVLKNLPTSWDLTVLYENDEAYEADLKRIYELIPELEKLRGTLNTVEGLVNLYEAPAVRELNSLLNKTYMYSANLSSLDASDPRATKALAGFYEAYTKYQIAYAFEAPEIMAMPLKKRKELFSDERLAPYAYYARKYTDPDYVVLSEEAEKAKTLMKEACNSENTHSILDNVELPRPTFTYPDGTKETLTETVYDQILQTNEYDQKFRKEIDELYNSTRQPYASTYASLLEGQIRRNWAEAQLNGFDSSLESALYDSDVDPKVYDRVIRFAHDMLPKFHEYFKARKKMLGEDEMMFCDLQLSVTDYEPKKISYEDALNDGRKALTIWGDEYMEIFDRIVTAPQIDVYPTDKKETGGYTNCQGSETMPYVLLNYDGMETYTSTIVHEMGHAVHLELSAENQNDYNNGAEIFTTEVASTANELLYNKYRNTQAKTEEERRYWLDQEITLFLGAMFRQCLYSEFEDYCYKTIEKGGSLDASDLADEWLKLSGEYYGKDVAISDDFGIGWARVPHFYYDYYVYQYATSITYAAAVCQKLEDARSAEEKQKVREAYLDFLKSGKSADPVTLVKIVGVDPMDDKTYEEAGEYISGLIDEFIEMAKAD